MIKLRVAMAVLVVGVGVLTGCSSQPSGPAEKPQPKPPEFLSGRSAFQQLYVAAHGWKHDAQPFRLESQATPDSNGQDGKSAVWRASFASAAGHTLKPYVWSGTSSPDAPDRGVSPGSENNYNPENASTLVFDIAYLKIDSDDALKVAQAHGEQFVDGFLVHLRFAEQLQERLHRGEQIVQVMGQPARHASHQILLVNDLQLVLQPDLVQQQTEVRG